MSEEDNQSRAKGTDHHHHPPPQPPPLYGTFQGVVNYPPPAPPHHQLPVNDFSQPGPLPGAIEPSVANYPPPPAPNYQKPVIGFNQPVPLPGATEPAYARSFQTAPCITEGERPLPCCGLGCGWGLFITGLFLGAIPWYIGLFILLCGRIDPREKPGYVACVIAAILATIVIIMAATTGSHADDG